MKTFSSHNILKVLEHLPFVGDGDVFFMSTTTVPSAYLSQFKKKLQIFAFFGNFPMVSVLFLLFKSGNRGRRRCLFGFIVYV